MEWAAVCSVCVQVGGHYGWASLVSEQSFCLNKWFNWDYISFSFAVFQWSRSSCIRAGQLCTMCTSSSTMCGRGSRRRWNLLTGPCLLETLHPGPHRWDGLLLLISCHCRAHVHEEQILETAPDRINQPAKYILYIYLDSSHFLTCQQPKRCMKSSDAAVTDRGHYKGESKRLYEPTPSHGPLPLRTTNYSKKYRFVHQDTHNQHGRQRGNRKILEVVIGSVSQVSAVTGICYNQSELWFNFELETDKAVVMWCPISSVFNITYVALLVKLSDFHD